MTYIPEGSFYRNLPHTFDARLRLRHEVLIYASDAAEVALNRIKERALSLEMPEISRPDRMSFMMDAWSIVDHVHIARQMIARITKDETRGPLCKSYLSNYETATLMRNRMDHMDDAIGNRVSSKSMRTALFGALSYIIPRPQRRREDMADNEIACDAVVIMMGSAPSGASAHLLKTLGADMAQPLTNVFLDAFDKSIDLKRAVYDLRPIVDSFAEQSEVGFRQALPNLARQSGLSEDKLRDTANLDLTLLFEIGLFI